MRMLITYAICIPVAMVVGYMLTNPLDFGTLGFLGLITAVLISPVFIRWHYPILVFGIACPMICFFLVGKPPFSQVVIILSLMIAIVERAMSSEKRFTSVPVMTWPLLYIAFMAYVTTELNGGIGLHSMGGDSGGGRKYITLFVGVATYFALTSQTIPRNRWKFYVALSMLPAGLGIISDFFPYLPSPLNTINLLFPPTMVYDTGVQVGTTRLSSLSFAVGIVPIYLLARYGMREVFSGAHPVRLLLFLATFALTFLGGYRNVFGGFLLLLALIFFMEGMHRTRLLPALVLTGAMALSVLAIFSNQLPFTFQRAMCFLPLKWDQAVLDDAYASSEWRYNIWRATWPKVPQYLLLGKGYSISKEDYDMIGGGTFSLLQASHIDAAEESLAISGDYHSGPLSTLIPFGLWGGIGIIWLMGATTFVLYRNYKYGDAELRVFNIYLFASCIKSIFAFLFIFGGFNNDVGGFASMAGFSIAMNHGVMGRPAQARVNPLIKPRPEPMPIANDPIPI